MRSIIKLTLPILFLMISVSVFSQQYAYDSNGNLTSDSNKRIASIHYNHLNLVDTIIYTDGRKMFYTYTASGQKLREQSIAASGTVVKKRDYVDHHLYANDSLREIQYEDGRAVPILPGNSSSAMEYQYHIKDHLGNVRTTLTSRQEIDNGTATFEAATMITEHNRFLRYDDARRINSNLFDHTHKSTTDHYSQRLNGTANEKYGLAKSLSVMPGDTIKLEVFAKYVDPVSSDWTPLFANLMTQIASHAAGVVVDGSVYTSSTTSFPVFSGVPGKSTDTGGPKAYLNWLVFDRNFVLRDAGYQQMSNMAKENGNNVAHERLYSKLVIGAPGYIYTYLSNEGSTPMEVYFDDFTVTQVKGPVIQQTDYDPFGLTYNEHSRENAAPNNFLYNGKELQKEFDLNWYDYGARMYDAALGRWHVVDPKAEKYASWSPYNYVMNNPITSIDPNGQDVDLINGDKPGPKEAKPGEVIKDIREQSVGDEILTGAEQNHGVKIYMTFVKASKFVKNAATKKASGVTSTKLEKEDLRTNPKTGKTTIKKDVGFAVFTPFAGKDVTGDAGKDIYLVAIALGNEEDMAETILHEIAAHANSDHKAVSEEMKKCKCDQEEAEHNVYGSSANGVYSLDSTGHVVIDNDFVKPGSMAEKVQKAVNEIYKAHHRER